jgi:uncharacterized protein (UPF0262 family)
MAAPSASGSTVNRAEGVITPASNSSFRIVSIRLGEGIGRHSPEIEQEKHIAIHDILEENRFEPKGSPGGPYHLILAAADDRLILDVRLHDESEHRRIFLSLTPFRRVLKDYHQLCQTYYAAIREAPPSRIEAIDMGRRGLHDDGSHLLRDRLNGKIEMDFDTARRIFTLISALYLKA